MAQWDTGWGGSVCACVTHLKQTFCQSPPDLRPQKGAKEEQGDLAPGNVRVLQERPFGELQAARATVPPRAQHGGGGSGDEVQVSRHGLHFRAGVPGVRAHRGAVHTTGTGDIKQISPVEGQRAVRSTLIRRAAS